MPFNIVCFCLQSPTTSQRHAALFNSTAVHASFGDVELAQITLRGMPSRFPELEVLIAFLCGNGTFALMPQCTTTTPIKLNKLPLVKWIAVRSA